MLSITGVILGLVVFVFAAYKRVNIVLTAILTSCLMMVFSGLPIYETLAEPFMGGMAGFLKKYLLMVLCSAAFGRLMSDGGAREGSPSPSARG